MPSNSEPITDYAAFWPYYLREHAKPRTRAIHILGTCVAMLCLAFAIVLGNAWLALAASALGYGPAWFAHFCVEKNRPATFRYPVWSLVSDFRMSALWLGGRLERELERAGVARNS